MATKIQLIAQSRDGSGTPKTFDYKPGAKHAADSNSLYKVVVDGQPELPPGTKIVRNGNSVVFHFSDGSSFEIENWCSISDSRLTDLNNSQAYSNDNSAYVDAKQIDSGACVIWGEGGQAAAVLGDGGATSGGAAQGASTASSDDHTGAAIVAGLLGLGVIGALAHGGGGDGSSNGPIAGTPDALNEDFSPVAINAATLKASDDHTAQNHIQVLSAKIKSASGFNVVVDNNAANDVNDDVQIVDVGGVPTLQVNASGENKFGTIVATVQLKDASGNVTTQDVTFTVNPVNDKPVNHVPSGQIIDPQDDFTIDASNLLILSVSDVDEATGPDAHKIGSVNLQIQGSSGLDNIGLNAGGTSVNIANNNSTSVTLTGTEAELNTVLSTVVYTSDGTTNPRLITLTMTTTDKDGETLDVDDIFIAMSGLGGLSHGGGGSVGLTDVFSSDPAPAAAPRPVPASIPIAALIGELHDPVLHSGYM
jgi:hypothetical protein